MSTFDPTHPLVPGLRRLTPTQVRRALTRRALYLAEQIRHRGANGQPVELFQDELRAIVQTMEDRWPAG